MFEELMYRAGLTADGCWSDLDSYDREAIMKFAKLIVIECGGVVACNAHVSGFALSDMIDKHFGIENED